MVNNKVEALRALGWTDDLIEHFMIDDLPSPNETHDQVVSPFYESTTMTIKYVAPSSSIDIPYPKRTRKKHNRV